MATILQAISLADDRLINGLVIIIIITLTITIERRSTSV